MPRIAVRTYDTHTRAYCLRMVPSHFALTTGTRARTRSLVLVRVLRFAELAEDDPNARARKSQLAALVNSFQKIMAEYQQIQESYRDNYKERVRRQARIGTALSLSGSCTGLVIPPRASSTQH